MALTLFKYSIRTFNSFNCVNLLVAQRFLCTKSLSKLELDISNEKLVKVAVIGVPNAGKSTFINNLIDHRVCPTSKKVHTTRATAKAITIRSNSQVILFDTPGLVSERELKKHHLESSFTSSCRYSIQNANIIAVVHDVSNNWTRGAISPIVLNILNQYPNIPSFLVLNKIDALKSKRVLLDLIDTLTVDTLASKYRTKVSRSKFNEENAKPSASKEIAKKSDKVVGWPHFSDVFMVSSLNGDGLTKVMDYILQLAKPQPWEHRTNEFTDQTPESLVVQSVRARLLDYLPQEIPYLLSTEIEYYGKEKNKILASVLITCPNLRIERLVCGISDGKLRQITERATSDLVETFSIPVSLTLSTRVLKKDK